MSINVPTRWLNAMQAAGLGPAHAIHQALTRANDVAAPLCRDLVSPYDAVFLMAAHALSKGSADLVAMNSISSAVSVNTPASLFIADSLARKVVPLAGEVWRDSKGSHASVALTAMGLAVAEAIRNEVAKATPEPVHSTAPAIAEPVSGHAGSPVPATPVIRRARRRAKMASK